MGKASNLSEFDKSGYGSASGNFGIRNGVFGGLFACSRCEHVSKMMYGWWNDKSPASGESPTGIDSRGKRRLLCINHRDRRAETAKITNSYNSGDSNSVSKPHSAACTVAYVLRSRQPKHFLRSQHVIDSSACNGTVNIGHREHGKTEDSCMV